MLYFQVNTCHFLFSFIYQNALYIIKMVLRMFLLSFCFIDFLIFLLRYIDCKASSSKTGSSRSKSQTTLYTTTHFENVCVLHDFFNSLVFCILLILTEVHSCVYMYVCWYGCMCMHFFLWMMYIYFFLQRSFSPGQLVISTWEEVFFDVCSCNLF